MKKKSNNKLAESLIIIRTHYGFTQETFAKKVGITRGMVAGYESLYREPSLDILLKISEVFNISIDDLLKGNVKLTKE